MGKFNLPPPAGAAHRGDHRLFKLSPGTSGWTETWVFNWQNTPGWGTGLTPLIVDSHGIFWGTDTWGGNAFKVVP
jgi:hypothetical protein